MKAAIWRSRPISAACWEKPWRGILGNDKLEQVFPDFENQPEKFLRYLG